mgnify:CR=1 FL=1
MLNIVKRDPFFGDIARFDPFTHADEIFKNFGMHPFVNEAQSASLIKVDLSENDKAYTVRAAIPGVKKEDIKVQVDGNRISISTETKNKKEEKEDDRIICRECYRGSSYRSFTLDSYVDESKTQAKYESGILELILPKMSGRTSKQIEIK